MNAILSPKIAQFTENYSASERHRLMFFLGEVTVRVAGISDLTSESTFLKPRARLERDG